MERREFLAGIAAIPLLSFGDIADDSLTVDNYMFKLDGEYTVIDLSDLIFKTEENLVFGETDGKIVVLHFKVQLYFPERGDLSPYRPPAVKTDTIAKFELEKQISAKYCNDTFKKENRNFLVIKDDKLMGFSIQENKE